MEDIDWLFDLLVSEVVVGLGGCLLASLFLVSCDIVGGRLVVGGELVEIAVRVKGKGVRCYGTRVGERWLVEDWCHDVISGVGATFDCGFSPS